MWRTPLAILAALFVVGAGSATESPHWPGFRGTRAAGVADKQHLPNTWSGTTGENIRWKVRVPGLAHSSPIVWGNLVFVTSAVSSRPDATFKPGLYGEGTASEDRSVHRWMIYALDKRTGEVLWERTAYEGTPKEKRHIKATYANATPVTDGTHVVAFFGSQGLYAWTIDGKPLWSKDLGRLNTGAYDLPEYEWGTASSPTLYRNMAIVQADTQDASFLLAADIATGKIIWKTVRQELPSWGTPTVCEIDGKAELVTNASNFVRGYDPLTGKELWRVGGSSRITAPTPICAGNLTIVASGRGPERPIFAIRLGAQGAVAWSKTGRGPYMPTPVAYDGRLYILGNAGIFDAYELDTGKELYRERIPHQGSGFSASPVAADGRVYLSSEDGDMFIVSAGSEFKMLGKNTMGEPLMATPALSDGVMYVRGEKHLFAVARK
jgi:outer membrane protein assembly factor BamB